MKTIKLEERTLGWLDQSCRLTVCHERRASIHRAFFTIGCASTCFNALQQVL